MYIATVIPISRGIPFDTLTYYASEALVHGTIVLVPFGKQTIPAIVVETNTLAEAKAFVKQATFSLKKIKTVIGSTPFMSAVAQSIQETSLKTLTPLGSIAANIIPQALFEYIQSEKIPEILNQSETASEPMFAEDAIVGTTTDRTDYYKRLIRTSFASKQSVLFVAPTIKSLELWHHRLEKGIAKHVVVLHSKIGKKALRSIAVLLRQREYPLLIFVTPGYLITPRHDIGAMIAEDESSALYKTHDRYGTDMRIAIKQLAIALGIKLYWGDSIPRFTTLVATKRDHLARAFVPDKLTVVPIEPYRTILPSEVIETIRHAQAKKQRIYIHSARKGIAPLSRCSDCGTVVTCPTCELPMVLRHKMISTPEGPTRQRSFICTHCADTLSATHLCSYCGSWNISPVAIGSESIKEAVEAYVGKDAVLLLDDDTTPDTQGFDAIIEKIHAQKFVVIIGTIKALPYIKQVHYCMFPFFDRLISVPAFTTTEQVLRLIMECNERATEGVLLFTKQPSFPFINQLQTQKINAIINDEITLRKQLGYPPFGSIIKIQVTVSEGYRQTITEQVNQFLTTIDNTQLPPRRVSPGSLKVVLTWILTTKDDYIEEEGRTLVQFLQSIRFPYTIEENPERLS